MSLNWAGLTRTRAPEPSSPPLPWPKEPPGVPGRRGAGTESGPPPAHQPPAEDEAGNGPLPAVRPAGRRARSPKLIAWLRQVSFRGRVSILVAAAVALAVALAALSSYVAVSRQMEQQANANLQNAIQDVSQNVDNYVHLVPTGLNSSQLLAEPLVRLQLQTGYQVQVLANTTNGVLSYAVVPDSVNPIVQEPFFRVTRVDRQTFEAPQGTQSPLQSQQGKDGNPYRVGAVSVLQGSLTIMLGYPLNNIDNTLSFLRLILILVALGGVALAATLGWAVGRASMRPVEDLTNAAERVAETQDLSEKIEDASNDELGRLARSFNAMLAALSVSKQQQAQLVSDAGHELRTPLTSLRTNIEVLMRNKDLPPSDRDELLADVDAQLQELATLVGDLVDLARDEERPQAEPEVVAFDNLVAHALERAKRRAISVRFEAQLQPGEVRAQPALLERAVINVLDNAAKWSPAGGTVTVQLQRDDTKQSWCLSVKDEGPGISPDDLPHIFDRFYRAASARSMPGSGLGLAIVKKIITAHGGSVEVTCPPEGGTLVHVDLPLVEEAQAVPHNGGPQHEGDRAVEASTGR